jgi:hypothetical protein
MSQLVRVSYTKRFTGGLLKGLTHEASLTIDRVHAHEYQDGLHCSDVITHHPWTMENVQISEID